MEQENVINALSCNLAILEELVARLVFINKEVRYVCKL